MSATTVVAFLLLLSPHPAESQSEKVIKSCPVLTNAEAAAVLGSGTLFASGAEATSGDEGKAHVLVVKGPLTLELRIGGKGATAADLPKVREAAKKAVPKL